MSTTSTAGAAWAPRRVALRFALLLFCGLQASTAAAQQAYVPNYFDDSVSVIDIATDAVVATIPVGDAPIGVAVAPGGSRVYITNVVDDTVSVIDGATNTVIATVPVGLGVWAVAVTPDGGLVYATNRVDDTVSVIDAATNTVVTTVAVGDSPNSVAFTPTGSHAYVANGVGASVTVIDTGTHAVVDTIAMPGRMLAVVVSPDGSRAYVSSNVDDIQVIDTASGTLLPSLAMDDEAFGLVVSPDGSMVYATSAVTEDVVAIDTGTGVAMRVHVGGAPAGIDVTPDGSQLLVTLQLDSDVAVIDAGTLAVGGVIAVGGSPTSLGRFIAQPPPPAPPAPPEGVNLSTPTAPVTYAEEIDATPGSPVALDNAAGELNLTAALGYNFSPDENRYARFECPGVVFAADATAEYVGGGSASVGAVNGLNSDAVYVSITAHDAGVDADGLLTITGGRAITGTDPVNCTYGLYDFPSQAAGGGSAGRVATVSGPYLAFAPSTVLTSTGRTAVADVEADPPFSAFVPGGATTAGTAALADLQYALATPAPLAPDGIPVTLADLHATGADGTRIVAEGDFSAVANADGSFTGAARDRVYLSGDDASCTLAGGIAASALDATQAQFPVGATATDTLLCLVPLDGTPIPVADYTARLLAVSADPATYTAHGIGPLDAGAIIRNGAQLQAPLVQVPEDWVSRVALTNTGGIDRPYVIAVMGEPGNAIGTANLTGVVPARGTVVIDLEDVLVSFSGQPWATLTVTVAGPNAQIQGVYQIVNPANGSISNETMVRPGTN